MDSPDYLRQFLLERAQMRGVLVRLNATWQQIQERADYPQAVARILGETLAASALLTGNIKFQGSLSIQIKGAEPLTLVFAECSHEGKLRGLARWQGEVNETFTLFEKANAILAITIENSTSGQRYQGLAPIENASLAVLFEHYFERSEQLPTRIVLASDGKFCGGIMLQPVAAHGGSATQHDPDAWNRVSLLLQTLTVAELLTLPAETLLLRLFHEEMVRLYAPRFLTLGCRCSRERVAGMLRALGRDEADAAVREDGAAEIICEFCNARYRFDRVDMEQVFSDQPLAPSSSSAH